MEFAHAAGLDLDHGRRNCLGCLELAGIDNPHRTGFGLDRCLRHHLVAEAVQNRFPSHVAISAERPRIGAGEHVFLGRRWRVLELVAVNAEVLARHRQWHMFEPVREQEGRVLVKIAVIEHEQEFAAVGP